MGFKLINFTSINIEPNHPDFNKNFPGWTQVQILSANKTVVAQFYGVTAKILANDFLGYKNEKPTA